MLTPKFIYNQRRHIEVKLNEDWDHEKIDSIHDSNEDTLELTNILSSFSDDKSSKDSSSEQEIITILRRNNTRILSKSNPEIYNSNLLRPKCRKFVPERVSNPFHKNPFGQVVKE